MKAICRSGSPTDNSFMEFNLRIGGPYVAPTVTALLTCRADRKWYFTDGTTPLMCDPSTVMFKKATAADETDAIMQLFNGGIGGPDVAPTVTARLTCRDDQKWYFTDGTTSL
ncbi:hypothetical protein COOONC_17461 [Cooperia oncophora]